ncbi:MAG: Na+/H+ antiporter NhaC [Vicinamibacterales bacterium]|jgi:NhaC family Na+:H+ antiporter|nr:Na+/H+ antiporter NhaC [Vicinamibacterales bacterium]
MPESSAPSPRPATLAQALAPVVLLVGLLAASVYLFGDASSSGPNQIALILAGAGASVVGLANGHSWRAIERGIGQGIAVSMGALLILLVVGSLIGTWILAGVVPTMIYYGLSILSPSVFYAAACAICALVSLATGSSWTTAGTIGIALVGIATAQGLHLGLAAGAIISGAYFGDKMSVLSDTTNLAPAVAGTDLFTHIRHMVWTTAPSMTLALVLFAVAGFVAPAPASTDELRGILDALEGAFVIGPHLLLPVALVLVLVVRRMPAFPALLIGALAGGLFAVLFQPEAVVGLAGDAALGRPLALVKGCWIALFDGYVLESGNAALDELLSRGGMASMLLTVWLIMAAMMFGAVMETTGLLEALAARILGVVRSTGSLISATLLTAFGTNVLASDQYISIVLPGRMFRGEYERRRLDPKNLSRTLEDAGTITSVLVPWNTCGAYMAGTLGVATFTYAPFCFFNLINPLVAALYGWTNISIAMLPPEAPHHDAHTAGQAEDTDPTAATA